jgi:cell wall-associated NlpC family hydrolase
MNLSKEDLSLGDHIYVKRLLYSHHGIYAGDGKVIHYTGEEKEKKDPSVRETNIDGFLKGGKLKKRNHKRRLPSSETLSLAKEHLSDKNYSLTLNNCEHFATYCATGKKKSNQVRKTAVGFLGVTVAVAGTILQLRRSKKKVG